MEWWEWMLFALWAVFFAWDTYGLIHAHRCPSCRIARQTMRALYPGYRIEDSSHRATECERDVVAVFYQRPMTLTEPSPYWLVAVGRDGGVEELPTYPGAPYFFYRGYFPGIDEEAESTAAPPPATGSMAQNGGRSMTEAEWLGGEDPTPLLAFAAKQASGRKVRLILTACCGRMLDGTPPERRLFRNSYEGSFHQLERALATVEQFADGLVGPTELAAARVDAKDAEYVPASVDYGGETELYREVAAVLAAAADNPDPASVIAACGRATDTRPAPTPGGEEARRSEESRWQAAVVRCVIGNPLRPVTFDPKWRTETAVALATGIYEERAFDRLPILADALEDVGCDDAHLLAHCRGPGPHVRGCCGVDLVLGKE